MGRGHNYENKTVAKLDRRLPADVNVYPIGYSGSQAECAEDVLITDDRTTKNFVLEMKNIQSDYCYIDGEQVEALVERSSSNTVPAIVVKFSHRNPLVTRYFDDVTGYGGDFESLSVAEKFAKLIPPAFDAGVTKSGRLSIKKPSLDDWQSATVGGDDVDAIISGLGIPTANSIDADGLL